MKNISVFAIILHNDNILLAKKAYGNKRWTLPGGAVEPGESLLDALYREIKEETNQNINEAKFLASFYHKPKYELAFCYVCTIQTIQQLRWDPNELESVQFFPLKELPFELSRLNKIRIDYYLQHKDHYDHSVIETE